jgi:hypothetical protein
MATDGQVTIGLAADFDLTGGEQISQNGSDFFFNSADLTQIVGIRPIFQNAILNAMDGGTFKSGSLSDADKLQLLQAQGQPPSGSSGDFAVMLSTGAITFDASGKRRVGFVIASGSTMDDVIAGLDAGAELYSQPTNTNDNNDVVLPKNFSLGQNFPNPFNATTRIDFDLAKSGEYRLTIFNSLGQVVKSYSDVAAAPGRYNVFWDGRSQTGNDIASGVYLYRLTFDGSQQTRKMVLLK